jgi:hypothetical protein
MENNDEQKLAMRRKRKRMMVVAFKWTGAYGSEG